MDYILAMEKFLNYQKFLRHITEGRLHRYQYTLDKFFEFVKKNKQKSDLNINEIFVDDIVAFGAYLTDEYIYV